MNKNNLRQEQTNSKSKPSRRRLKTVAIFFIIIFTAIIFALPFVLKSMYPSNSDIIIKNEIAKQLNKDPNELTKKDFLKVTQLSFVSKELSDLSLLGKCINLEELSFEHYRDSYYIPKWNEILLKFRIMKPESLETVIDLQPLMKLTKLKILEISSYPIYDLEPIKELINLECLSIYVTDINNIEPVKGLKNLKTLSVVSTKVKSIEPIKELSNLRELTIGPIFNHNLTPLNELVNLQELNLSNSDYIDYDLESISNLTNLKILDIELTGVTDLKPIKAIKKLEELRLSEKQTKDLKILLELENLKTLSIYGYKRLNDLGNHTIEESRPNFTIDLESVKKLKSLKTLILHNVYFSQSQKKELEKANPDLEISHSISK